MKHGTFLVDAPFTVMKYCIQYSIPVLYVYELSVKVPPKSEETCC